MAGLLLGTFTRAISVWLFDFLLRAFIRAISVGWVFYWGLILE